MRLMRLLSFIFSVLSVASTADRCLRKWVDRRFDPVLRSALLKRCRPYAIRYRMGIAATRFAAKLAST